MERESEAHLGAEAEEILPFRDMVDSQTETIDRSGGVASAVSVGRFGERREAISRKGGDFWSVGRQGY